MPFLRFSRDKRGYEHTYLVQATNRRGKPVRPRVLYWFRTPPAVRLGRQPFDEEVRRLLETQNPGIAFDWATIVSTPFPSQEPEHWRERRKAERAARQSRREEEDEDIPPAVIAEAEADIPELPDVPMSLELAVLAQVEEPIGDALPIASSAAATEAGVARKRRRRGGRRRRGAVTEAPAVGGSTELKPGGDEPSEPPLSASEDEE